jgi:hypothetical protein
MNAQSNPGPVDFDLSRGRVDRRADAETKVGHDDQVVLVPVTALAGLEKIAGAAVTAQLARSIGVSFGSRVAAKIGSAEAVAKASLEVFVSALAGEVAVSGWGVLHLERWGRAMVLVVDHAPALPYGMLAALLEGAVSAAAAREVHAVALAKGTGDASEARAARVLIVSARTAEHARRWLLDGASEAEVIRRLHDDVPRTGGTA